MLASVVQTFAVALLVVAAIGYLGMLLRRSAKGGGCSGCTGRLGSRPSSGLDDAGSHESKPFVPSTNLADRARRLADDRDDAEEGARKDSRTSDLLSSDRDVAPSPPAAHQTHE